MGRGLGAVDAAAPPRLRALAVFLREVKAERQVTYAVMARHNSPKPGGASTFIAAASGARLPSHASVPAYLAACCAVPLPPADARVARDAGRRQGRRWARAGRGPVPVRGGVPAALLERADRLWLDAYRERAAGGEPMVVPPAPAPGPVRTREQLAEGVKALYRRAGSPPLRFLEVRTGEFGCRVPRATLSLILTGAVLPTGEQFEALLAALSLPRRSVAAWLAAWGRVQARARASRAERAPASAGLVLCADSDPKVQARWEQREQREELLRKMGKLRPGEDYDEWLEREERAAMSRDWMDWMSDEELV